MLPSVFVRFLWLQIKAMRASAEKFDNPQPRQPKQMRLGPGA